MRHGLSVGLLVTLAFLAIVASDSTKVEAGSLLVRPTILADGESFDSFLALHQTTNVEKTTNACPPESQKRIALCQKIIRTFLQPNPKPSTTNETPFLSSWSSSRLCQTLQIKFPASVNYEDCQSMAGHIYGAAGATYEGFIITARKQDIQDVCVTLLSTPFPAGSNSRLLETKDASTCTLAATGGFTGLRVLMLHGMGMRKITYRAGGPDGSEPWDGFFGLYAKYWDHTKQLDGLADVRYFAAETLTRGWSNLELQKQYCAAIQQYNPHAIFTHSMGNNIIAAAIANKVGACTRISKTPGGSNILWFSAQAPWFGTPAAATAVAACSDDPKKGLLNKLKAGLIRMSGQCKETATVTMNPGYKNTVSPTVQFTNLKQVAASKLSGALCGLSAKPFSLKSAFSSNGASLWFLSALGEQATLVDWGKDTEERFIAPYAGNDGLVNFQSCNLDNNIAYAPKPSNPFYVTKASHEDGACFFPDVASLSEMDKPCQWYIERVKTVRATLGVGAATFLTLGPVNRAAAPVFATSYPKSFLQLEDAKSLLQLRSEQLLAAEKAREERAATKEQDQGQDFHSHLESSSAAELSAEQTERMEAEAQAEFALSAGTVVQGKVESQVSLDDSLDAAFTVAIQGQGQSHLTADESIDAELEAEVVMETQHQSDLDEENEMESDVLEAQLEGEHLVQLEMNEEVAEE